MSTLDFGVRNQYNICFSASPVFECALGIAVITREEIYDKLDRNLDHLRAMRDRMSEALRQEVKLSGEVHLWRNLLFLAHRCPILSESPWEHHIPLFLDWLEENENRLFELAVPYLGEVYESELQDALSGSVSTQQRLIQSHSDNPVIHLNLQYLFSVDSRSLLTHLKTLLRCWYEELLSSDMAATMAALHWDKQHQKSLAKHMQPTDLIRKITKGSELKPVPGTNTLWLIPHCAYRPFTIINYLPQCVVYYYPVSDEFLPGGTTQTQMLQVALLHKALGDVQRIRLLSFLGPGPKSLAELTESLGATKSNVHHHLTLLRTAELVHVHDGVYSLNPEAISHVGDELKGLLEY